LTREAIFPWIYW